MFKERRCFRRLHGKSGLTVSLGEEVFQAKTVDYSFDGLSVLIEGSPAIGEGDEPYLAGAGPYIKGNGRVVRRKKTESGVILGIRRVGHLYGSLKDFTLADVLIGLQRTGKTGTFHFLHGPVHKTIYIQGGDMIFAASNQPEDRLGDMLLRSGKITTEQYASSVEYMKRTRKRQGLALVELGYLEPGNLLWAVTTQVENIILSLFGFTDGNMGFKEESLPTEEVITLKLSASNLVYRGIKGVEDIEYIKKLCPPVDTVLVFSSDPLDLFQDLRIEEADKRILSMVDGKRSLKEIVNAGGGNASHNVKILYALLSTRIIEDMEEFSAHEKLSAEEAFTAEELFVPEETDIDVEEETALEFSYKIDGMYGKYRELGYYGVLGVEKAALPVEIKKAYFRKAREFHPDRHFQLPDDMKEKLNAIFTFITDAYSTLSDDRLRREYDEGSRVALAGDLSPADIAVLKFEDGKTAMSDSMYAEAARLFAEAAYLNSSVAEYHFNAGVALQRDGRHKEAERAIQRALKIDPDNADYHTEAGYVFFALGFSLRARGHFNKALKLRPSHERAGEGLSMVGED